MVQSSIHTDCEENLGAGICPCHYGNRKSHRGVREIMGTRVILHRIDRARFFGFEYVNYGGVFVPVSDVEKTLIDFNYYHIKLSEETLESIIKKIDKVKLLEYEKRMIKIS